MAELKRCVYVNSMTRVGPDRTSAATQMTRQAFWDMSSQYASLLPQLVETVCLVCVCVCVCTLLHCCSLSPKDTKTESFILGRFFPHATANCALFICFLHSSNVFRGVLHIVHVA